MVKLLLLEALVRCGKGQDYVFKNLVQQVFTRAHDTKRWRT